MPLLLVGNSQGDNGMQDVEAFTIRACGPGEAGRLAATAARLFTQAYGPTHPEPELGAYLARAFAPVRLATELAQPDRRALVVESGGRWIGYAWLRESAEGWPGSVPGQRPVEIVRFYVDAGWHGRGVAAALMAACEGEARQRGADALWLAVWQEAARPLAFYRRAGFEVVGTATFAFGDRLDDDFVMARRLAAAAEAGIME
jgi:ribosomal protein S18 acetylase RimI-like enzyme